MLSKIKESQKRYQKNLDESKGLGDDNSFRVNQNVKAQYDKWAWIYSELSNLRVEISRLGYAVRVNNSSSPSYLKAYHSHLYSFLIPLSVAIKDTIWEKIDGNWLDINDDINVYMNQLKSIPNKKIPAELIRKLDKLYRTALLIEQRVGLGFRTERDSGDMDSAIEAAITGTHYTKIKNE